MLDRKTLSQGFCVSASNNVIVLATIKTADEKDICQDYVAATASKNRRVRLLESNVSMTPFSG